MLEIFEITLSNVLVLFVFISIGYGLSKTGILPDGFSKGLAGLLVNVFVPCLTFNSMANNFKLEILSSKIDLLVAACLLLCGFLVLAFVFSRVLTKNKNTRDVYLYSFTFPNAGYFGNPLVLAIFGELMLFDFILFNVPFVILTYTFGVYILNPNRNFSLKNLLNPIILSLVLGMCAGIFEIKFPTFAEKIIETGANSLAPAAMILTGVVFANNSLKKMVSNIKVYIACAIKLVIIPIIAVFIIAALKVPQNIAIIMIINMTLPTGLNSIVFPEAYGGDSRTGAQLCFVSTFTCLIFLPLILTFYQYLCI